MSMVNPITPSPRLQTEAVRSLDRKPPIEVVIHQDPVDTVDLSEQARLLDALHQGSDIRTDLVSRVRSEIAQGTYVTDERLDKALDALIDDLLS